VRRRWRWLCLLLPALAATGARARDIDPSTYMFFPQVDPTEREVDWHAGVGSDGRHIPFERDAGLGFGLAPSDSWFTELAIQYRQPDGAGTTFDSLEWENVFQLAEPGEWPVDLGWVVEIDQPHIASQGTTLTTGPLLQKDFGRLQANLNVLASYQVLLPQYAAMHWSYQAQVKYRARPEFEWGVQAFGSPSSTNHVHVDYADQTHRLGPLVTGRLLIGSGQSLQYNAAFLFGITDKSPSRTFRVQLEYEF
jgi:hypothetical protein